MAKDAYNLAMNDPRTTPILNVIRFLCNSGYWYYAIVPQCPLAYVVVCFSGFWWDTSNVWQEQLRFVELADFLIYETTQP